MTVKITKKKKEGQQDAIHFNVTLSGQYFSNLLIDFKEGLIWTKKVWKTSYTNKKLEDYVKTRIPVLPRHVFIDPKSINFDYMMLSDHIYHMASVDSYHDFFFSSKTRMIVKEKGKSDIKAFDIILPYNQPYFLWKPEMDKIEYDALSTTIKLNQLRQKIVFQRILEQLQIPDPIEDYHFSLFRPYDAFFLSSFQIKQIFYDSICIEEWFGKGKKCYIGVLGDDFKKTSFEGFDVNIHLVKSKVQSAYIDSDKGNVFVKDREYFLWGDLPHGQIINTSHIAMPKVTVKETQQYFDVHVQFSSMENAIIASYFTPKLYVKNEKTFSNTLRLKHIAMKHGQKAIWRPTGIESGNWSSIDLNKHELSQNIRISKSNSQQGPLHFIVTTGIQPALCGSYP